MDPDRQSITGHSMGGHGAMVAHLKNPGMYTSGSAFAPIANPVAVPCMAQSQVGLLSVFILFQ